MTAPVIDCRSAEGETVTLIEAAIVALRLAARSGQLAHPAVAEALKDIRADREVAALLDDDGGSGQIIVNYDCWMAAQRDAKRLDAVQEAFGGTGHTLMLGGVCYWAAEKQRGGPRSKIVRVGQGNDLRAALDDAQRREWK